MRIRLALVCMVALLLQACLPAGSSVWVVDGGYSPRGHAYGPYPHPGYAGVGRSPQAIGSTADVAKDGQARIPGLSPTSTRRTMPNPHCAAPELAWLLGAS
jgi:hypothetical protein